MQCSSCRVTNVSTKPAVSLSLFGSVFIFQMEIVQIFPAVRTHDLMHCSVTQGNIDCLVKRGALQSGREMSQFRRHLSIKQQTVTSHTTISLTLSLGALKYYIQIYTAA